MSKPSLSALVGVLSKTAEVTPEKMKLAIDAVERERKDAARMAFVRDFIEVQKKIPKITATGELERDGKVIARFSDYESIMRVLQPLLTEFGFMLAFHNEFPEPQYIEVLAVVTHKDGHHAENPFRMKFDFSDKKTDQQAAGSAQSYAKRYAVVGLFNIVTAGQDRDGVDLTTADEPEAPESYDGHVANLKKAATKGEKSLSNAFKKLPEEIAHFIVFQDAEMYRGIKATAAAAVPS